MRSKRVGIELSESEKNRCDVLIYITSDKINNLEFPRYNGSSGGIFTLPLKRKLINFKNKKIMSQLPDSLSTKEKSLCERIAKQFNNDFKMLKDIENHGLSVTLAVTADDFKDIDIIKVIGSAYNCTL